MLETTAGVAMARKMIGLGLVVILFLVCYAETIGLIVQGWLTIDVSYGWVIFAISLSMIWFKRDILQRIRSRPSLVVGGILTLLGCLVLLVGHVNHTFLIREASIIITLVGLVALLCGTACLRVVWVPILYLFFALPVPGAILGAFSIHLQNGAAYIAAGTLRLVGMPVVLTQHCLELPHISLDVVRECSGINHIIALMSLAIPIAFFSGIPRLFQLLLVVFSFFLGIFLNGLRVAMIGLWSVKHADLHGPVSTLFTSSIFFAGLVVLLLITYLPLSKGRRRAEDPAGKGKSEPAPAESKELSSWGAAVSTGVLILLGTAVVMYVATPKPVQLRAHLAGFPVMIGDWQGEDVHQLARGVDRIAADDVLKRIYRSPSGRAMGLYVGYFSMQDKGRKVSSHVFDDARGGASIVKIPGSPNEENSLVRTALDEQGKRRQAYYFYDINGRQVLNKYTAKLVSVVNGIFRRRTNAALVVFVADTENREVSSGAPASAEQIGFMKLAMPKLREYLSTP